MSVVALVLSQMKEFNITTKNCWAFKKLLNSLSENNTYHTIYITKLFTGHQKKTHNKCGLKIKINI